MLTEKLLRPFSSISYLLLATLEAIAITSSLLISKVLYESYYHALDSQVTISQFSFFYSAILISMMAMGLYHSRLREKISGISIRITLSLILGSSVFFITYHYIPHSPFDPKLIIPAISLSFIALVLIRIVFLNITRAHLLKRNVLILGAGKKASIIQNRMRRESDRRGFIITGFIDLNDTEKQIDQKNIIQLEHDSLNSYAEKHQIDEIVIAADERRNLLPLDELKQCKIEGIKITDIVSFVEKEAGKIALPLMHPTWLICSDGFKRKTYLNRLSKRTLDITLSLLLLFITWPIMLLTALSIRIESGFKTPIIYKQSRVGLGGHPFNILKFRSMQVNAESDGAIWAQANDARVTVVGSFIRKYRIDELPQIFNILKGDMSFIGPRPERPEFVSELSNKIPYYNDRHQVKPGLTGWAQLCYPYGACDEDALEKLQYDFYYIKNHSFFLDLIIIIQTAEVILFGKGSR